jgi:hypothetical protein
MARVLYVGVDWADSRLDISMTDDSATKLGAFRTGN